ncbi:MAG: disulfide bond formation protein B [Robiginitomaculum sp.]|nr:MAG: disulfide bond formation protein B [Robiginitomaculum sp.]
MKLEIESLRNHWALLAAMFSSLMLAAAHGFEHFGGMAPCELCLRQREVYWVALALGLGLTLAGKFGFTKRGALALLGLVFLTGGLIAGYHAGVEWKFWPGPASCTGNLEGLSNLGGDLLAGLDQPGEMPKCDQIPWSMLGISMAGWNALLSMGLAMISFKLAMPTPKEQVTL